MKAGTIGTRRQSTGRLFIKPSGDSAYVPMGDVMDFKLSPDLKRNSVTEARKGYRQTVRDLLAEANWKYDFTLDETTEDLLALIHLSAPATAANQASATSASTTALAYLGRSVLLPAVSVSNVVITKTQTPTYSAEAVTCETTGHTVQLSSHGLENGMLVEFDATTVTAPTGTAEEAWYYVVNKTTNAFQISATRGGTPILFSSTGTTVKITTPTNYTLVADVDYTVDLGGGEVHFLPDSVMVADADSVTITYDKAAVKLNSYTALDPAQTYKSGDVIIHEYDQHSEIPIATHSFTAQYYVTDRGSNDGSKVINTVLSLIAQTRPAIVERNQ